MSERVTARELIDATRQLALLARLGYPLAQGLRAMGDVSRWLGRLGEEMEAGDSLAQAVRRHPRVFSPFYAAMVQAAEASEKPHGILSELSRWLEDADRVRRRLRLTLFYPLLVIHVLIAELLFVASVVVPRCLVPLAQSVAHQSGASFPEWPGALAQGAVPVLLILVLVLDAAALKDGPLMARIGGLLPFAEPLRRLAEQGLWARALGSLLGAGVELPRALRQSQSIVQVPSLRKKLGAVAERVERGSRLGEALAEASSLDPYLAWSAAAGESREDLAPLLLDAADQIQEEVARRSAIYLRMAEPWAMVGVGILVALGLLAFWWPFYSMVGAIR